MNTSNENPEQAAGPDPVQQVPVPSPESARFYQWLRGLGVQRGNHRWVGGVCSGLADKWGIDPVVVRGLAVVLSLFFGVGLLAYGVAWALLPEPDGRIHVQEVGRGHWSAGMTGATALTVVGMAGPGQGFLFDRNDGGFLWPLFWIAGVGAVIYWAINRDKDKDSPRPSPAQGHQDVPQEQARSWPGPTWQGSAPGSAPGDAQPLNYAGEQPYRPDPQLYIKHKRTTPRLGAAASFLVLGMAAVVGATVLLLEATGVIDLNGYQTGIAAAAAAVTAGVGIMVAGVMGRTAGGLGTFAVVMLVLAGLMSLPAQNSPFIAFNNSTWTPQSISAAQDGRTVVLGNATLDLTLVSDGTPLKADVQIPVDLVVSSVTIRVPDNIPVSIKSELAAASLTINGDNNGGVLAEQTTTAINPASTGPGLVIILQGAASNISVTTVPAS